MMAAHVVAADDEDGGGEQRGWGRRMMRMARTTRTAATDGDGGWREIDLNHIQILRIIVNVPDKRFELIR